MTLDPDRLRKLAETPTQDVLACFPDQVSASSKSLRWPGLAAWVQHGPAGELYVPPALLHTVILKLSGPADSLQMRVAADGSEVRRRAHWSVGDICIVPAGEAAYFSREVDSDNLHLNVEPGLLARYAATHATETTLCLGSRIAVRDERMRILGMLVLELLRNPAAGDTLFIDTLGQAIAAHLLATYTSFLLPRAGRRALDPAQVRRVCAFIDANLDAHLTLQDMAGVLQMSVWHFSRCFKHATAKTPFQFVMERRMQRAFALLSTSSMRVTEIALEVGFSDPSHFSRRFKKHFGANPAAYLSTRPR